jgi:hypothetical protein
VLILIIDDSKRKHLFNKMETALLSSLFGLSYEMVYSIVSQTFLFVNPFWLLKITTDPHVLARVNTSVRTTGTQNYILISQDLKIDTSTNEQHT